MHWLKHILYYSTLYFKKVSFTKKEYGVSPMMIMTRAITIKDTVLLGSNKMKITMAATSNIKMVMSSKYFTHFPPYLNGVTEVEVLVK